MDKIIVTVLLIITGATASVVVANSVYPAIGMSEGAIASAADAVSDRMQSRIEIIQAAGDGLDVQVWVKNVGTTEVCNIEQSDIFIGPVDDFTRASYGSSGPPYPYWSYQLEGGGSEWDPAVTLKITIHLDSAISGACMVKMVIPNGIGDEKVFGVQ